MQLFSTDLERFAFLLEADADLALWDEMAYLPGNEEYQEEADWVINRLVEDDIKSLPDDFLEYHRSTMSAYWGMRGEILETEEYASAVECAAKIMQGLRQTST